VGIPIPPKRVEPWRSARGKWEFRPIALQIIVDTVDLYCLISFAVKYVATRGYDIDGIIIEFKATHLRH
jgi:hypothetical protein